MMHGNSNIKLYIDNLMLTFFFKKKGEECLDENHQIPDKQTTSQYI